jgi:hypothetical protein
MSAEVAAAIAEPVVVPPADQPPEPSAAPKSFEERWKAVESTVEDDPAPAAAADAKPAAAEKPAKAAPTDTKEAKRAQLKALALELGLTVDDAGVSTQEAIEVRAAKRKNLAWKAEQEAKFAKERTEWESTNLPKLKRTEAADAAFDAGDPDAFAQAYGAKDWNELQSGFINRIADPNYKELKRIKDELEKEKAAKAEAQKQSEEQAARQQQAQVRANYFRTLSDQCKASQDPLARALAEDMGFLQDVFAVQKEHWDPDAQKTVSIEEAIKLANRNGPSVHDRMKSFHDRLSKAFGSLPAAPAAAAPAAPAKNGKKPAPKTAVTPPNTVEGGGAPKRPSEMTPQEWREYSKKRMETEAD